uniref:Photolyase/cryptochrome alpha/beta domain-containing protein n=1 Tax=Triticum urartu TaxID=4572 RepID=A0A8R7RA21_TRIUA
MADAASTFSSFRPPRAVLAAAVPSLGAEETAAAADEAFRRHTSTGLRRGGGGVAVVWFRSDLRVLDNEALARAWAASGAVLPVYCVDPRVLAGATHRFGFPKTGGEAHHTTANFHGIDDTEARLIRLTD